MTRASNGAAPPDSASSPGGRAGKSRPVLYLDLDDTVISWATGDPEPGEGAHEFLVWALDHFEVRWLTTWCPDGRMDPQLLRDLSSLTDVPVERLRTIRGFDWEGGSKLDGIAWLEHVVLGRPFLWVEDSTVQPEWLAFLDDHGLRDRFRQCDVTRQPEAVRELHAALKRLIPADDLAPEPA